MIPNKKRITFFILAGTMILAAMACKIVAPTPTVTAIPSGQLTVTVPPTPPPTATIEPTPTATASPAWIAGFAEPILVAIGSRSPDYHDDFSNPYSGWDIGHQSDRSGVKIEGEVGYLNGEYFTIASSTTVADPTVCSGGMNGRLGEFGDFAARYDAKFVTGQQGDLQLQFHKGVGQYTLTLGQNGVLSFTKCGPGPDCSGVVWYSGSIIKSGQDWNHFLVMIHGPRLAAYLNGEPVLYWEDGSGVQEYQRGQFSLTVCNNGGNVPLEARWDNFQLWDISNLP
jgi:hypothetical protein